MGFPDQWQIQIVKTYAGALSFAMVRPAPDTESAETSQNSIMRFGSNAAIRNRLKIQVGKTCARAMYFTQVQLAEKIQKMINRPKNPFIHIAPQKKKHKDRWQVIDKRGADQNMRHLLGVRGIRNLCKIRTLDAAEPAEPHRRLSDHRQIGEGGAPAAWRLPGCCRGAGADRRRAGCLQIGESGALAAWPFPECVRDAGPTGKGRAASKLARVTPPQHGDFQDTSGTQNRRAPGGLPPNLREWRHRSIATSRVLAGRRCRPAPGGRPPNWREWRPCSTATSMLLQ